MLSFLLMSHGVTDWHPMLDIASKWFLRMGITTSDNPKLMIINIDEASQLALKATKMKYFFGIAEIAMLSYWKMQELHKGSLSMRELIQQGDMIERHLHTKTETGPLVEEDWCNKHIGAGLKTLSLDTCLTSIGVTTCPWLSYPLALLVASHAYRTPYNYRTSFHVPMSSHVLAASA
ncbi:hypothetical protein BDR07DRAFT_1538313 [Suillus spraguei]|nr:hypothetical protein BDR07DRAFT_1538313 [Suillus spraguei]